MNTERRSGNLDKVSYETFEVIMDRLEKEWFDLTKNLPKPDLAMPSEDSTCAICDDSEGENTNAIVFCDGCNLAVHQDCYGVPYIPEGQWLCRKCTVSPENPVCCILCPNEGGAFKQTVHGEWVHLLCAIWVPETRVANDVFMEPVTGVDRIPKQRWKLKCSICDVRTGACIQCIKASCFSAFHATCARKEKLLMPMKASQGSEAPTLACYCEKHLPREQAEARLSALQSEPPVSPGADASQTSKTARAYAKTYKPGPPLVPKIIVERILQYVAKVSLRQKREFVLLVCKYWSLKREARRGAPLLKRLHLEPWTASTGGRQSDEDKAAKLKLLKDLREDLERLKTLSEAVRQREVQKLKQQNVIKQVLQGILYPFHPVMRAVYEIIKSGDKNDYFLIPVSRTEVPDYYDVITKPMSWSVIDKKLSDHAYMDLQEFKDDIFLVLNNAITYNKSDTPFHRTAQRIKKATERAFPELERFVSHHTPSDSLSDPAVTSLPHIGDLEPSLRMLDLLINAEHIQRSSKFVLEKEPLEALFSFELGELKPPPTPPPAPATPAPAAVSEAVAPSQKPKRDRRAERERAAERRASTVAALTGSAPRTRRARAAAGLPVDEPESEPIVDMQTESASLPSTSDARMVDVDGEPPAKRRRGWKRAPIVLPGQSEVLPVVDAVDSHTSFSMFDAGWILPEGHKRVRAAAPVSERPEGKKTKKHAGPDQQAMEIERTAPPEVVEEPEPEAEPSKSVDAEPSSPPPAASAGEAEEPAEPTAAEPGEDNTSPLKAQNDPMEIDTGLPDERIEIISVASPTPAHEATGDTTEEEPEPDQDLDAEGEPDEIQVEQDLEQVTEDEASIIEDHPYPYPPTTDETTDGNDQNVDSVDAPMAEPGFPLSNAPNVPVDDASDSADQQSELTALSDSDSARSPVRRMRPATRHRILRSPSSGELTELPTPDEGSDVPPESQPSVDEELPEPGPSKKNTGRKSVSGGKKKAKGKKSPSNPDLGKVVLKRGQPFLESGTLVWGKLAGFPWWPGVVFDVEDELVPKGVLDGHNRKSLEANGLHIVQFYDEQHSWALITVDFILMLGESEELDDDMTSWKSSRQTWKTKKAFQSCHKAFLTAMEQIET